MRRAPDWVQREAAPRNKCRVPWQQREFPDPGGRKQPQPDSRQRKQNPGGAKWTKGDPQAGALGALGIRGIPSLCQSEGTRGSRRGRRWAERCPPGVLGAGRSLRAQRSRLHSRPPPLSPLRKPTPLCRRGPTNPALPPLLEPRKRAWRLRALRGAGNTTHCPFA
nr:uncharacterized protein LOC129528123 [Gorilla gorilla gorilla]